MKLICWAALTKGGQMPGGQFFELERTFERALRSTTKRLLISIKGRLDTSQIRIRYFLAPHDEPLPTVPALASTYTRTIFPNQSRRPKFAGWSSKLWLSALSNSVSHSVSCWVPKRQSDRVRVCNCMKVDGLAGGSAAADIAVHFVQKQGISFQSRDVWLRCLLVGHLSES